MNILIKLMSIVSLIIAPHIAVEGGHNKAGGTMHGHKMECSAEMGAGHCGMMMGNCEMDKCKTMSKDECAAYCDSVGCTPEQKEKCLSMYGADGKFDEAKCKEMCKADMGNGACVAGCAKGCKTAEECKASCGDECVASHAEKKGACCADGEKAEAKHEH